MSAGMAYEAMNHAGHLGKRLVVVLNDNEMSIAPPVGALSSYLSQLYAGAPFQDLKQLRKALLVFCQNNAMAQSEQKDLLKKLALFCGTMFEALGFSLILDQLMVMI